MQRLEQNRILISGGGTGGHVFPAIAIANSLRKINPLTDILFVGAVGRLEMQKVPEAGYKIEGLNISGFQRDNLLKNLNLPFKILGSLLKAGHIIRRFKPHVAVGVGGYASGPTLYRAWMAGIPTLVQEQNSFAGVTNKLMAKKANRFCVAYDGMDKFFPNDKIIKTGNPVRDNIAYLKSNRTASLEHFGLEQKKKTLLVIGGSLGAKTINDSILFRLEELNDSGFQVLWQTGKVYYNAIAGQVTPFMRIKAHEFIKRMELAYDAADVIISRAGAISISELCTVGKPVVLVPSPNVAEDDQTKNALALTERNAALLVKDNEAKEKLVNTALELMKNENKQLELSKNIKQLAIPDAAERIAKEILALIE